MLEAPLWTSVADALVLPVSVSGTVVPLSENVCAPVADDVTTIVDVDVIDGDEVGGSVLSKKRSESSTAWVLMLWDTETGTRSAWTGEQNTTGASAMATAVKVKYFRP